MSETALVVSLVHYERTCDCESVENNSVCFLNCQDTFLSLFLLCF